MNLLIGLLNLIINIVLLYYISQLSKFLPESLVIVYVMSRLWFSFLITQEILTLPKKTLEKNYKFYSFYWFRILFFYKEFIWYKNFKALATSKEVKDFNDIPQEYTFYDYVIDGVVKIVNFKKWKQ